MIPSTATLSADGPCHVTQRAIANVERAMRQMRASRNFYPQQDKALLITFHPIPKNTTSLSLTPSPTPTEPVVDAEQPPVLNAPKRRMRKSKDIIEAMLTDSAQAGNLVKMLKTGSWN